jgi:hypothetical protein
MSIWLPNLPAADIFVKPEKSPKKAGQCHNQPPRPARYKSFNVAIPSWRNFLTKYKKR